jgi:calcium/proton exchanger cax
MLSVIALVLPAAFDYTERGLVSPERAHVLDERLSLGVSVVLILVYLANLFYTLVTHRDVFASAEEPGKPDVVARTGHHRAGGRPPPQSPLRPSSSQMCSSRRPKALVSRCSSSA